MHPQGSRDELDDYTFCMAVLCLKEHVMINGLRHHKDTMSDSKRGYDYPLHHLWMMTLTKEERDEVLQFLWDNEVPAGDVLSFTVYHGFRGENRLSYNPGYDAHITYRYYLRDGEGNIQVHKDSDGDWQAVMDTDSKPVKTEIPRVIIDALWNA